MADDLAWRALAELDGLIAEWADARDIPGIGAMLLGRLGRLLPLSRLDLFTTAGRCRGLEPRFCHPTPRESLPLDHATSIEVRCIVTGARLSEADRIALPLMVHGTLLGVLSLAGPGLADPEAGRVLPGFATALAVALSVLDRLRTARLLREAIDQSDEAISFYDVSDGVLFTNPAYHRVFTNYPPRDQVRGLSHEALYRLDLDAGIIDDPIARSDPAGYLADRVRRFRALHGEVREVQKIRDRTYLYVRTRSETGATLSRRVDITDMKAVESTLRATQERLEEIAFTDPLTGLPNRRGFRDAVAQAIAGGRRRGDRVAVLFLDLDRFKGVNDSLGHATGDALLQAVGVRLRGCVRETDLVARLGGDEFAILQREGEQPDAAASLAGRVVATLGRPYELDGRRVVTSASIGIGVASPADAPAPGSADPSAAAVDLVLSQADLALYRAKAEGRSTWRWFEAGMDHERQERHRLAVDLAGAIARDEFDLHYQPIVDIARGTVCGLEALLRWRHPQRGDVMPSVFVPVAEEAGQISAIGHWVLRRACADARRWAADWPADIQIAVNLSPRQLIGPALAGSELVRMVADAAQAEGIAPARLEVEITESVLLDADPGVLATLHALRALGVRIALDDFGTGFSSLSYLLRFPFTKIKIDRGFVSDVAERADCQAIVGAVAGLARRLGMITTAEGVETAAQLEHLREAGCTQAQGYLIARPAPAADVARWFAAGGFRQAA